MPNTRLNESAWMQVLQATPRLPESLTLTPLLSLGTFGERLKRLGYKPITWKLEDPPGFSTPTRPRTPAPGFLRPLGIVDRLLTPSPFDG